MSGRFTDDDDKALLAMAAQGIKPLVMGVRLGRETAAVVRRLRTLEERAERQSQGYALGKRGKMSDFQKNSIRIGLALRRQRLAGRNV